MILLTCYIDEKYYRNSFNGTCYDYSHMKDDETILLNFFL